MHDHRLEDELKQLIVDALQLEDITPQSIDVEAPLLVDGLGLDSIDALELAIEVGKRYGATFRSEDPETRQAFASVRSLAGAINARRGASPQPGE